MSGLAEPVRTRLLPALLTAVGVTLLAAGLLSFTTPVTADPGVSANPPASGPDESTTPTLISLPPLGSTQPSASASFPADRVVTRVRVAALRIDLPVVAPGSGTEYPLCNVAQYFGDSRLGQPGEGRATYLYGHARAGMFLPLLDASKVQSGKAMLGMIVEVWTSDDQRFLYEITEVRRHAPALTAFADPFSAKDEELWLQTSEGPAVPSGQTPNPKLQVVAKPLSQQASSHSAAHPKAHPVVCG
jgi:hypothetical protein